jgi:integrase
MQVLYERCAGVDVGKDVIAVAVRLPGDGPGGRVTVKRTFRTFYGVLREAARWLTSLGVTQVAMEATGVIYGCSRAVRHDRREEFSLAGVSVAAGLSDAATLHDVMIVDGECRTQRVVLAGGEATWTVLGPDLAVVGPAEEFLEYLRVQGSSPNTVKSYARALGLWWSYLSLFGLEWDALTLSDVGGFLSWLRSGDGLVVVPIEPREPRFTESTVSARLRAVTSCYRFHELNGVALGGDLVRVVHGGRAVYKPVLDHLARKTGRHRSAVRVRVPGGAPPPVLSPAQITAICDACARPGPAGGQWEGRVRDRLLWLLLAESGLRLGEALGLQHRDWHTGRGDTPFIEVVPREHPHGVRVKGQRYRRVFVSDDLDALYGEYAWQLCEAGADLAVPDLDAAPVFVNLSGGTRFAPWRPGSVYDLVTRLRRDLAGQVPGTWSPHWMRHSHATALLLSGVPPHVVSRRLGHADVQTTLELYAHVTDDADMRAVAEWRAFTAGWRPAGGQDGGRP